MTATRAIQALVRAGVAHEVHAYAREGRDGRDGYAVEAAEALGVEPARVFKTLLAAVEGRREPAVVALVPASGRLDLRALAAAAGGKRATMVEPAVAERLTGYVVGGIAPLGQRRALRTFVDASLADWPTVFVSAGRRGLEVELAPADLVRLTSAALADLASPA